MSVCCDRSFFFFNPPSPSLPHIHTHTLRNSMDKIILNRCLFTLPKRVLYYILMLLYFLPPPQILMHTKDMVQKVSTVN